MGRTYRGTRKDFGSMKSKNHKARSKWFGANGTRLRTLNVDIQEFVMHEDSTGFSLHRAPVSAEGRGDLVFVDGKSVQPWSLAHLTHLSTESLLRRKAYAVRQVKHLQKLVGLLREQHFRDNSFIPAMNLAASKRRSWDTQLGVIGPILSQRAKE